MLRKQGFGMMRDLAARWRKVMGNGHAPGTCTVPGICSIGQFAAALEREWARADRNGHQISVALILVGAAGGARASHLLAVLHARLRVTDEAGWYDKTQVGVLMPYTSCHGAWHMLADLCRLMQGELSLSDCRVYLYPCERPPDGNGQRRPESIGSTGCLGPLVQSPAAPPGGADCPGASVAHAFVAGAGPAPERACVYPLAGQPGGDPPAWQRGLDIVCAGLGLIVLAPVFLLTALLIRLVSSGPVFFKQVRIGWGGKPFVLWKFRTMVVNADTSVHRRHVAQQIRGGAGNGLAAQPMTKLDHDPRVIPFGGILRGTCIDELPQLINVLRGEMSLVGPRPPIPYEVNEYLRWQKRRLDAVPGLTGLWQVSGKNRLTFDEMVRLDIRYSRQKSFWMNIKIILRTPGVILREMAGTWGRNGMRTPDHA
jgi:lipopolysaccharide/colanic/teichoic acid biosynthesis glycosyltransferase